LQRIIANLSNECFRGIGNPLAKRHITSPFAGSRQGRPENLPEGTAHTREYLPDASGYLLIHLLMAQPQIATYIRI
jgi:hypothetical protein